MAILFDVIGAKKDGMTDKDIAEYLSTVVPFDVAGARKDGMSDRDIITFLNKTKESTPLETFLSSAKQEMGSEIKGIYQLAGGELDTAAESQRRQMEAENPMSGLAGSFLGGLVNPSTLLPGSMMLKGAKGVALASAVGGGVSGALQPIYGEEDLSRLSSAALGVGFGGVLGGALGLAINKRVPKGIIDDIATEADKALGKNIEANPKVFKDNEGFQLFTEKTPAGDTSYKVPDIIAEEARVARNTELGTTSTENVSIEDLNRLVPDWKTRSASITDEINAKVDSVKASQVEGGIPTTPAADTVINNIEQFSTVFKQMDSVNPAVRKEAEQSLLQATDSGDYTNFLKTVKDFTKEYEFGKTPIFKLKDILSETNPFAEKNLGLIREMNLEKNIDSFRLLQSKVDDINTLRAPDTTPVPESEAVQSFLARNIGEVIPLNYQNAVIPWLEKELKSFQNLDNFYREMLQSGIPEREALTLVRDSATQFLNVTSQVLANRSQAARLLNDKGTVKMFGSMKNLMKMLESGKGIDLAIDDAAALVDSISRMKADAANGTINLDLATSKLARDVAKAPTTGQKISEAITNAYTSGIQTAAVNALTPPVKMMLNGLENILMTLNPMSKKFGKFRQSYAAFQGMLDATTEALYFGERGFVRGVGSDDTGVYAGKAIGMQPGASKAEKIVGETIRTIGTRPSVFFDEVAKTMFRKAALYDQYHQLAYSGRFKGREKEIYNQLRKIDTKDLRWSENIVGAKIPGVSKKELQRMVSYAREHAKYNTFQADLGTFGQDLLKLKTNNPIGTLILPFVKTPINILKDAMTYIPGINFLPGITPSSFQRTASGRFAVDAQGNRIKVPYLTGDQKFARAVIGMGALTTLALNSGSGMITGSYPKDPGKRAAMQAANIPEYSVKIGDNWVPYGRVEPLATSLGMMVDSINIVQERYKMNPNDRKLGGDVSALTNAMANNLANKTFLQGLSGMLQAMNDPERHGSAWVKGFASLAVPGVVAQFAKAGDPNQRISEGFGGAVQARVPGMREDLPLRYNLTGNEPAANPAYGINAFTGIGIRSTEQSPAQQLIATTGAEYKLPNKKIRAVDLTDTQQSEYQRLSAQMIEQRLSLLANAENFTSLPKSIQKRVVEQQMKAGRKTATSMMVSQLSQDPAFVQEMFRKRITKKGLEDLLMEDLE